MRIIVLFLYITLQGSYSKDPLFAELSNNKISINAGFTGAKLVLYGAIDAPGDLAVAITGPRASVRVRLKEKKWGIWLNKRQKIFTDVPGYYAVAASKPLSELKAKEALYVNQIGINNIRFAGAEEMQDKERKKWIKGLTNSMLKSKRYIKTLGKVEITDNTLFKTEVVFTSVIPSGTYTVDTLLLRDGNVIDAKRTLIKVSKSGIGAEVYNLAHSAGLLYGILAVFMALFVGWFANVVVRKT